MKKEFLIASGLLIIIVAGGCIEPPINDNSTNLYKGISTAEIPAECIESSGDVCVLFECMVDMCWCELSPSAVLVEGTTVIVSEQDTINLVQNYVQSSGSEYTNVERAVNLGDEAHKVFFNVFAYNSTNDEEVFTVVADGTIIKTVCGV